MIAGLLYAPLSFFLQRSFGIQTPFNADVLKHSFSPSFLSFILSCHLLCPVLSLRSVLPPYSPLLSNLICSQFVDAVYCDRPPQPPSPPHTHTPLPLFSLSHTQIAGPFPKKAHVLAMPPSSTTPSSPPFCLGHTLFNIELFIKSDWFLLMAAMMRANDLCVCVCLCE